MPGEFDDVAIPRDEPPMDQYNIVGENKGVERDDPPDGQRQWPKPTKEPRKEPTHGEVRRNA